MAGGLGSRLKGVVKDRPKPMADINGKPFLSFIMDYLLEQKIDKVLLSVGYKYEAIMSYYGSKYKNLNIQYIVDELPLGTGGAVKKALQYIRGEKVFVINGDTLFRVDLNNVNELHNKYGADITIAAKPMKNIERYGTLVLDKNKVVSFQEKSFKVSGYINGGVYLLNKKIFKLMPQAREPFSFEVDFLEKECVKLNINAIISDTYFIDIGIPEDYERAKKDLR